MSLAELISYSFYFFFALTITVKVTLILLNINFMKKHFDEVPKQFQDQISLEDHQKAQRYTTEKAYFSLFSLFVSSVVLLYWLTGGGLSLLSQYVEQFNLSPVLTGVFFIFAFSIINSIIDLPEKLYSTFKIEEKYGFNKTTPKLFIIDQLKGFVLGAVIGIPFLYAVLSILDFFGDSWWIWTFAFIMSFQLILVWAYPKFIAPIFNKFTPLENEELEKGINELAQKADINFEKYFVMNASMRSAHGNAYFTGFGKNKRVVFFDTLLNTLQNNEVLAVLAHELGHMKLKHIVKMIIMSAVSLFVGLFALSRLYDLPEFFEAFGVTEGNNYLALIIFTLIMPVYTYFLTPISSWFSRKHEFEADEFAAVNTNPKDLITALLKMYKDNSSSLTPHPVFSKFYYSHPPANERINFLEGFIK